MREAGFSFRWADEIFIVPAGMAQVGEIEAELGGVPALAARFAENGWTIHECVCLLQIMMQAAGRSVDYVVLGDAVLRGGVPDAHGVVLRYLKALLCGVRP